jgi:tetratricopeptide (TPR) repeat protein
VNSGPGIVVCAPVGRNADARTEEFGNGCGRWLRLVAGGHGELGQTPLWSSLDRARRELAKPDLRFSQEDAPKLAPILGVTHVAVGEIEGNAQHCTLTYHLWEARGGKVVGAPLTLTGSQDQVSAALPDMARRLLQALGIAAPRVPAKTGVNGDEMAFLGRLSWTPQAPLQGADAQKLRALAARAPLAGLYSLRSGALENEAQGREAVKTLVAQAPDSPILFAEIAYLEASALLPYRAQLRQAMARYPKSYLLAHTDVWVNRVMSNRAGERKAAERVVRCAPRNPDAWLSLGYTLADAADAVRKGKVYAQMSGPEAAYVESLYPEWLGAVRRAAGLDPRFGKAWLRVAEAACFAGENRLADQAFWKAASLDEERVEVYEWGCQMYQQKWLNDPFKLARVAEAAAADHYASPDEALTVAGDLKEVGQTEPATRMLAGLEKEAQEALRRNPNDADAHYKLAGVMKAGDRLVEARREMKTVVRLKPQDAQAHYDFGLLLDKLGRIDEAIQEYQETVRLNPEHNRAHYDLGWDLKERQRLDEAEREIREAIRLDPAYENNYHALGEISFARKNYDEAIRQYRKSLSILDAVPETWLRLCEVYSAKKDYPNAIQAGRKAVMLKPEEGVNHDALAYACLKAGKNKEAEREFRQALRINAGDATAHENLGNTLIVMGQKAEARQEWETVLTLDSGAVAQEARHMLQTHP